MPTQDIYESPLVGRYASSEMAALFGNRHRILTWRQIWLTLATQQHRLGLPISAAQLTELKRTIGNIDFAVAAAHEKRLRHDVMAHLHAWGDVAPKARGILHLGATSMDVVDNADLLITRDALGLIRDALVTVIRNLSGFARQWRNLPCLGYTHFQPAQLTTVGRRACLWIWDFTRCLEEVEGRLAGLRFRGIRGATGTQASFLALFKGNARKVAMLEQRVAKALGFTAVEPVTGQTYSRLVDVQVINCLGMIAAAAHKFANDIRLLAGLKEMEEPFEKGQVGSSAMAYKRNPMRCERITGLARHVIALCASPLATAAEQWLERTLDDSSNKRLTVPESFLAVDAILRIAGNVADGLVVYPQTIGARVAAELPFMATEEILLAAAAGISGKGRRAAGDRQDLHERIRVHSQAAAEQVKRYGKPNDLIERLAADPAFAGVDLRSALNPRRYIGLAPQQVDEFLRTVVRPALARNRASRRQVTALEV